MAWWRPSASIRSVSIAVIVTATHVALAAIFLSQKLEPMATLTPEILEIELAELAPEIEVPPEPIFPVPDPDPIVSEEMLPPVPASSPPPQSDPAPTPQSAEPLTQTVLTQLDEAPSGLPAAPNASAGVEASSDAPSSDMVTPAQVASALEKMHCLKLKRHEEGACQPADPFTTAIESAERAIPQERLFGDPRYVEKSVSDKRFEREAAERFHWPDADLFADPMGEGAYNARRIRNGQEPLWSKEMRDGFRKSDD